MATLTTESYIPGVIALKKSLFNTKTKHPLVILIPSDRATQFIDLLRKNNILDENCSYLVKPPLDEKYISSLLKNNKVHSYWINTFFKLAAASCTEFNKIVLLDSDLYIQNNIDELFEAPHYSAIASRINGKLGSGVIIIEPKLISYEKLLNCIEPAIAKRNAQGLSTGDQDVLREYLPNWENKKELVLPGIYNCYINDVEKVSKIYNVKANDIYVIHFWGKQKPWNRSRIFHTFKICMLCLCLKFKRASIYSKYISLLR